jgi:hypothetical protein
VIDKFVTNESGLLFKTVDSSSHAIFSEDRVYRYMLSRKLASHGKVVAFICLNPSIADEKTDDPTVKRCINFAKSWGASSLIIGNLFAFRSTDPNRLKITADPIGPENDSWLHKIVYQSDLVIAAWGNNGNLNGRANIVKDLFKDKLHVLRLTKHGLPYHPLYLPGDLKPITFQ